jgi:hypothetical protein
MFMNWCHCGCAQDSLIITSPTQTRENKIDASLYHVLSAVFANPFHGIAGIKMTPWLVTNIRIGVLIHVHVWRTGSP